MLFEIGRHLAECALHSRGADTKIVPNSSLMEALTPLTQGSQECNAEAPAPIAKEVGEGRGAIILLRRQLRVADDRKWHEEEGVTDPSHDASERVVAEVSVEVEATGVNE